MIVLGTLAIAFGCSPKKTEKKDSLKEALLFHASFDNSTTADFAKGDPNLYNAPSRRAMADSASTDLIYAATTLAPDAGISGGALKFNDKTRAVAYFKSKDNLNYHPDNWQGTISFWLKLNPNEDLKPGFCDPIQITDAAYNDASIWVDFTKDSLTRIIHDKNMDNDNNFLLVSYVRADAVRLTLIFFKLFNPHFGVYIKPTNSIL